MQHQGFADGSSGQTDGQSKLSHVVMLNTNNMASRMGML